VPRSVRRVDEIEVGMLWRGNQFAKVDTFHLGTLKEA
jgi:hypothetical protein